MLSLSYLFHFCFSEGHLILAALSDSSLPMMSYSSLQLGGLRGWGGALLQLKERDQGLADLYFGAGDSGLLHN